MVDEASEVAALFNRVAHDYDQHVPLFSAFAALLVEWADIRVGQRVLDMGSGRGAVAGVVEEAGATAVRVDLAIEMLRQNSGLRANMDGQALALRNQAFDRVVSSFAMQFIPDRALGVAEAVRVLVPGGVLAIALPGPVASTRWDFYNAALAKYRRLAVPSEAFGRRPFTDAPESFAAAGLVDVQRHHVEVSLKVADPATFLHSERSHGVASLLERLAPDLRIAFEAEVLEGLEAMQRSGGIVVERGATLIRARKPAQVA